jgi:hypothetical protein
LLFGRGGTSPSRGSFSEAGVPLEVRFPTDFLFSVACAAAASFPLVTWPGAGGATAVCPEPEVPAGDEEELWDIITPVINISTRAG